MMEKRRIVQIAPFYDGSHEPILFAVADDGTLWRAKHQQTPEAIRWQYIPGLPAVEPITEF